MKLDEKDVEILRCLQEDARLSHREVAKRVGVSAPTVTSRLKTLVDHGVIRDYTININHDVLDQIAVLIMVWCRPSDLDNLSRTLAQNKYMRSIYAVSGSGVACLVCVPNEAKYREVLLWLENHPGITTYNDYRVIRKIKQGPIVPLEKGSLALVRCFECRRFFRDEPIKVELEGRDHYFCTTSCEKLFRDRLEKIIARM